MHMTEKMKENQKKTSYEAPDNLFRLMSSIAENKFNAMEHSAKVNAINYISPTDADIAEAGPEWDARLTVMEVEELEVINIELSDYPLPENPTTYDWWWA